MSVPEKEFDELTEQEQWEIAQEALRTFNESLDQLVEQVRDRPADKSVLQVVSSVTLSLLMQGNEGEIATLAALGVMRLAGIDTAQEDE